MSQVSRRSEVGNHNGTLSTHGYLLALLQELSQCPLALKEITMPKQVQPVSWKMRLEMVVGMQNEILIGIMKLFF